MSDESTQNTDEQGTSTEDSTANDGVRVDDAGTATGEDAKAKPDEDTPDATKAVDSADDEVSEVEDEGPTEDAADNANSEEISALKKDLKVERTKVTNLTKEKAALTTQVEQLQARIEARNKAEMDGLSDEEKALVMDFAGGDDAPADAIFDAMTKARKHNLVGDRSRPPADRTRTAGGDREEEAPKTWAEADARSGLKTH